MAALFTRFGVRNPGADLGGGCRGVRTPAEMKPSSYSLLKFVYLTGQ